MSVDEINFEEIEKKISDPLIRMVIALLRQALDESRKQNQALTDQIKALTEQTRQSL